MACNGKYKDWISGVGLERIKAWSRDGLTNEDIAHNVGISTGTFYEWLKRFPELSTAVKITREVADLRVENALYKRARGYDYDEVVYERKINKDTGEEEMIPTKSIRKHVQPDVTAQIFWLKNRKPDVWRDKREVQADVNGGAEVGVAFIAPVIEETEDDKNSKQGS